MSQCIGCANQPSDTDSLGGGAHEGTVTPMVVGIIIGTVAVFVLVVCALFYCVKLENNKHRRMAKIDEDGGDGDGGGAGPRAREEGDDDGSSSVKSRPSSVTVVAAPTAGTGVRFVVEEEVEEGEQSRGEALGRQSDGGGGGSAGGGVGKKRLFAWGRKSGEFIVSLIFCLWFLTLIIVFCSSTWRPIARDRY